MGFLKISESNYLGKLDSARNYLQESILVGEFRQDYFDGLDSKGNSQKKLARFTLDHMFQNGCSKKELGNAVYFYIIKYDGLDWVLDFLKDYNPSKLRVLNL